MAILQIDATVATGIHNHQLNVQAKIAVLFFGHNIGCPESSASGCRIIGHHCCATVNRIVDDFPFNRERRFKPRALPVRPFLIQHFARTIDQYLGALDRCGSHANIGTAIQVERRQTDEQQGDP